jgi:3',5'-cyclic AMP phosphodiesterase CpdA
MRKIVHLSDVHFGTADTRVTEMAIAEVHDVAPDIVVLSGDLTQRARTHEFKLARAFLDRLPVTPQIVVPGNHDVPLYNVFDRFFRSLDKYKRFITSDLTPTYIDDEIAIVGVNTARAFTIKGGRINDEQLEFVRSQLCDLDAGILKIIVTHHPFDLPEGFDEDDIVGRAAIAMPLFSKCGGDVFLSGHLHVSNLESTARRYKLENGRTPLIVQAGTATSTRVRGEPHSFNVLEFDRPNLRVVRMECTDINKGFGPVSDKLYRQDARGLTPIEQT